MKKIDIRINNAKILSYQVELKEDMPEVSAMIGLFAGEKRISTFTLTSGYAYSDSMAFELPYQLIDPVKDIAKQLETILVKEANKDFKQLTKGRK